MNETLMRKKSRFLRELNAVWAIMARDITIFIKSPSTIIMSFAMPIIMMGMIGGNLMQNMTSGLGTTFGSYMLVGMIVNMMFMMTSMNMTSLVEDHQTDFTQEMLISPVSRYSIVIGKIFGSMFGSIISLLATMIVGLCMGISLTIYQFLIILAFSPLMCLAGGALAMILIGSIKSNKVANFAVMIITMPQMFLSGAIIPITSSTGVLWFLSRILPMTYCLDLMRSMVFHGSAIYSKAILFNPFVNLIAIISITVICLVIGTYFFARSEKNK